MTPYDVIVLGAIGPGDGLSPIWRQAISCMNAGITWNLSLQKKNKPIWKLKEFGFTRCTWKRFMSNAILHASVLTIISIHMDMQMYARYVMVIIFWLVLGQAFYKPLYRRELCTV